MELLYIKSTISAGISQGEFRTLPLMIVLVVFCAVDATVAAYILLDFLET